MDPLKKLKNFKVLTPTANFRLRITNYEGKPSILYARLVYSWLAYRSCQNLGSSTRSICAEVGLHPTTVKQAVNSLGDLVERRDQEWIAIEPPEGLFVTRSMDEPAKHWADALAYSVLFLPRKGAKVTYPAMTLRFGLNHAIVWSYLIRRAKGDADVIVRRFTMAGCAKLYDLDPKTVRSIMQDLVWLGLIKRVDLGSCSEITTFELSEKHLTLFQPRPEPERKVVEPVAKKPANQLGPYHYQGDAWDECRRVCEGAMAQVWTEKAISKAKRLGQSPDVFIGEFHRIEAQHERNILAGKIRKGHFGKFLNACYDKPIAVLEKQEQEEREEQRLRDLYHSPEFQKRLADDKKAAEANPSHPQFIMSDEAILARVRFDKHPIRNIQVLESIKRRIAKHVDAFLATKHLRFQEMVDSGAEFRARIHKHALAALNHHYKQPVLATSAEYEQAIDQAIQIVEPAMPALFEVTSDSEKVSPSA